MTSLKRTLAALPVLVVLWLMLLAVGVIAGAPVRAAANAALSNGGWLEDDHLLGGIFELLGNNPAVVGTLVASVVASTVLGVLFWIPMAGGLFEALAGHSLSPGAVLSGARWSLPVLVQTLYSWVLRAIVLGILIAITKAVSWAGILIPVAYVSLVLAFDLARARIILLGAKPFSPMTLLRAWVESFRAPVLLLLGALLVAMQLVAAHLPAGIAAQGGSLTLLRLAAFLPLFFSAWRISAAITRVESDVG